jgi:hypothetical protein
VILLHQVPGKTGNTVSNNSYLLQSTPLQVTEAYVVAG